MNAAHFFIILLNFIYIGILPRIFFRQGQFNLMWWMTGGPFFVTAFVLIGNLAGVLPYTQVSGFWGAVLAGLSLLCTLFSVGLISFTLGTHRIPLALWHQDDDAPKNIVTYGAYKYIRHPFYTSFIIAQLGAFLFAPQWGIFLSMLASTLILNATASKEEKKLSVSEFGEEYKTYVGKTGRFFPKVI